MDTFGKWIGLFAINKYAKTIIKLIINPNLSQPVTKPCLSDVGKISLSPFINGLSVISKLCFSSFSIIIYENMSS